MSHLSSNGPSRMVFEHFWDCYHPKDSTTGFPLLFQPCSHIAQGHIPPQIACVFWTAYLLAVTKLSGGIHLIVVGETLYRFTSRVLCLQFRDAFITHFSSHQFAIKGGCEAIIRDIKCTLDPHPNWVILQLDVANAFNLCQGGSYFKNFV
jgi:hypothetical protein